jgi:transaldolase
LRTPESVLELAGIDRITMPPNIIEKLEKMDVTVERKVGLDNQDEDIKKIEVNEKTFRWMVNEDEIGNEKLADGIRVFAKGNLNKIKNIFRCY